MDILNKFHIMVGTCENDKILLIHFENLSIKELNLNVVLIQDSRIVYAILSFESALIIIN